MKRGGKATAKRGKGRPKASDWSHQSLVTILQLVRSGAAATRQEIERESELGRAIVADRLWTLASVGLVDESELGVASGGRAPRLVRFKTEAARILLATLDQTAIGVGIADLSGNLLTEHHEAADFAAGPEDVVERLCALFDWALERHKNDQPVWGIGISVPGPVPIDLESNNLFTSCTPSFLPAWEDFPFVEILSDRYNAPVWLRSSVETMTMGELKSGLGHDLDDMLFIKVGKRIGAGIVLDGKLYRGAQGAAGMIGQLPVRDGDNFASLESLAGSDHIAEYGRKAAEDGRSEYLADILNRGGEITAIEVGQAAQVGDAASVEIMSQAGHLLGHAVATLANMLNPSLIVLSGSIAQTNDTLLAAIREVVYGESHPMVTRDLRIIRSQMGSSAGLVGAGLVVTEALFDSHLLRGWVATGTPLLHADFKAAQQTIKNRLAEAGNSDTAADNQPAVPAPREEEAR